MTENTVTLKFGPQHHVFDLTLPMQMQLTWEWDTVMRDIVKQLEDGTAPKEMALTVLVGGLIGAGLAEDRAQAALFSIVLHGKPRDVISGAYAVATAGLRKRPSSLASTSKIFNKMPSIISGVMERNG
ncbi:hypothetical protein M2360_000739 [Rhizobium sp. SG_E_25_P2]|uniref:GTA-gp10 family protein n=1 Tax=Rhizobium sp. SG_E_25_P2 TaxID=2879942 RepID=UPI0024758B36|nr:GTA-gp10 family protein [Rhizobium sp. SG_E_25_P2]MDH6265358.1 hypothetical protein [Rhizobium sp. SG_E_25_P2]